MKRFLNILFVVLLLLLSHSAEVYATGYSSQLKKELADFHANKKNVVSSGLVYKHGMFILPASAYTTYNASIANINNIDKQLSKNKISPLDSLYVSFYKEAYDYIIYVKEILGNSKYTSMLKSATQSRLRSAQSGHPEECIFAIRLYIDGNDVTSPNYGKAHSFATNLKKNNLQDFGELGGYYELARIYSDAKSPFFNQESAMAYAEQAVYYHSRSKDCSKLYIKISDSLYIADLWKYNAGVADLAQKAFDYYSTDKSEMAKYCLDMASARGNTDKYANIYGLYYQKEDLDESFRFFKTGADNGDPVALYNMAYMLYNGWLVYDRDRLRQRLRQDEQKGIELFKKALSLISQMDLYNLHPDLFIAPRNDTVTLKERLTLPFIYDLE